MRFDVRLIIFITVASAAAAAALDIPKDARGNVILMRDGAFLVGPAIIPSDDPRRLVVSPADFDALLPFQDARGCPRWRLQAGQIVFVDSSSRNLQADDVLRQWKAWRLAKLLVDQAQADGLDSSRPGIYARLQADAAAELATLNELQRAGKSADDGASPLRTTVTPITKETP